MRIQISAGRKLNKRAAYTVGPGLVCQCTGQFTLEGSVQGGGVYTGGAKFFYIVF